MQPSLRGQSRHVDNGSWMLVPKASKQVFQHGEAGRATEGHGEGAVWCFAWSSIEHGAKRHIVFLRGPPWPSLFLRVEKFACLIADVANYQTVGVANAVYRQRYGAIRRAGWVAADGSTVLPFCETPRTLCEIRCLMDYLLAPKQRRDTDEIHRYPHNRG